MRTFESDFEYEAGNNIKAKRLKSFRAADERKPVRFHDPKKHESRILAHIERVQKEMDELGILIEET